VLRVLTYHRIARPEARPLLDPRLISATPEAFAAHMAYLKQNYAVLSMEVLLQAIVRNRPLPRRAVLVTFDDGYRDFRENAWPILKLLQLPATLFVPTAYPGQRDSAFWWDRLYRSVIYTTIREVTHEMGTIQLETAEQRRDFLSRVRQLAKTISHADALALVEEVCTCLGEGPDGGRSILDWNELRELASEGVTIAAHSRSHALLTRVSPEQAREEIAGSQLDIEREIGKALPVFCYPGGRHNDAVVRIVRAEGFALAFTTMDGFTDPSSADLLRLRRTNITPRTSSLIFRLRLMRPVSYLDMWRHREQMRTATS
jgi:peptidoglycan/xylan/chitin deacetylase (PgdA/CDA1 family)